MKKNIKLLEINGGLSTAFPFVYGSSTKFDNILSFTKKTNLAIDNKNVLYFLDNYKDLLDKVFPKQDLENSSLFTNKLVEMITNNETGKMEKRQEIEMTNNINRQSFEF